MKILAVSDLVVASVYSSRIRERFGDADLVLSCGDLPYSYLEFIVSMLNVPAFFVHGNHDHAEYLSNGRTLFQPGGWVNLDERVVESKGLLIAGLEGSIRYRPGAPFQYTDGEMLHKILRLTPALLVNRLLHGRYLDILITHSPPRGIHDGKDQAHQGFVSLLRFIAWFRPRYLLPGHKHVHRAEPPRTRFLDTEVINVCPVRVIEF